MMVGGDELIEEHSAVRLVAEKVHHLLSKLFGALNFLHSTICRTNIHVASRKNLDEGVFDNRFSRTSLWNRDDCVHVQVHDGDCSVGDLRQKVHQFTHTVICNPPISREAPEEQSI